jgi:hypothetical protein
MAVGIRRRSKSTEIVPFLNRGGRNLQTVTPERVSRKDAQFGTTEISALGLDGWSDSEYSHISAAAESRGTERAWINRRIGVRLVAADVIHVTPPSLTLDRDIIRDPEVRRNTEHVQIARTSRILDDCSR